MPTKHIHADRKYDVVTFGETMLRLSAPGFSRLEEAASLDVRIGGSESNTAVALARLGMHAAWWSKLPANPMGRRIENEIRRWGVDTESVIWDDSPDSRAGLYFLDFGVPPRGTDVYYDRASSSASRLTATEMNASPIPEARLLHLTGITPALSPYTLKAVSKALEVAKGSGTAVSFDVNYRSKLWPPQKARESLEPLLSEVDLLICPISDAGNIFCITGDGTEVAREFIDRYGVGAAVITLSAGGAVAITDNEEITTLPLPLSQIVDRVGAGDAFNAGLLMGFLDGNLTRGLQYGTAMAALKHSIPGDLLISTRQEIDAVVGGSGTGIKR
jgi:2-dehydro-3-deoxygluconokinase